MSEQITRAALIALATLLCSACTHAAPIRTETSSGALAGAQWRRIDDEAVNGHFPTIIFEDGAASGFAGCNRWFASVTRDGDALSFGQAVATRMACAEPAMAVERRFFDVIKAARTARIVGEELVLSDEAGNILARFRR